MKAALQHKNGDPTSPEVLSVVDDAAIPEPAEGQVLVKVACASVNPIDYKLVAGDFPGKAAGPFGCDLSGTVEKLGPGCGAFPGKVGDRVYADAIETPGSFAEYAVVKAGALSPMPANVSFKEAAALPLAGLTALQAFQTHGKLRAGQKVAILGGSGGVGSLAVQMAKALGAGHVYATGSAVDLIKGLGADTVINYKEVDVVAAMDGLELDLVFDTVGGVENWLAAKGGLKKGGAFLSIVGDGGSIASIMRAVLWRNAVGLFGLVGPTYKVFLTSTDAPGVTADMKKLTELVEAGEVKPLVDAREFELTTASLGDLIKASMTHRTKGKLVATVSEA
jgi:NADPH:quinone reductase-like Zn-dependent oxidoreductase